MSQITVKCHSCGSDNVVDTEKDVFECRHCGAIRNVQDFLVKNKENEFLNEVAELRNKCDFKEAEGKLDEYLTTDAKNYKVYFQLLLCKYGVSYIDENDKVKHVPIINYAQEIKPSEHHYYKKILETCTNKLNLDRIKEDVAVLDKLNDQAYSTLKSYKDEHNEYDIFISFKKRSEHGLTLDSEVARNLYEKFTKWGFKVFFADASLKGVVGEKYEPFIYGALFTAKVFVLVAASPDTPEILRTPWVKSEWNRFIKRMDDEPNLKFVTVLDNGFSTDYLPKPIQPFQAIKLDDKFDNNFKDIMSKIQSSSWRSNFENLNVLTNIKKLSIKTEKIEFKTFAAHKNIDLDYLETDFEVAKSKMKSQNFEDAYARLTRIQQENIFNFELNEVKLKCLFRLQLEDTIEAADFRKISYNQKENLVKDFSNVINVADKDQRTFYIETFKGLLLNLFKENIVMFYEFSGLFYEVIRSYPSLDSPKLYEYINKYKEIYLNSHLIESHDEMGDKILFEFFKRNYAPYKDEGALEYLNLLSTHYKKMMNHGDDIKHIEAIIQECLSINEYDYNALWDYFILNVIPGVNDSKSSDIPLVLAGMLGPLNFREIPLDEEVSILDNKNNLYYYIVTFVKAGLKMTTTNITNPFYFIFNACVIMINKPEKVELAKSIFKLMANLLESSKTNNEESIDFLLKCGERLLIEEKFEEASQYFDEVTRLDENELKAYWGLAKCEAKCPTNYSIYNYSGETDFFDLPAFRQLLKINKTREPEGRDSSYSDFLSTIELSKSKNENNIKRACELIDKNLKDIDDPVDDPLPDIIKSINDGTIIDKGNKVDPDYQKKVIEERLRQQKIQRAQEKEQARQKRNEKHNPFRNQKHIKGTIFSIILRIIILASIVLLHPLIALGVCVFSLILWYVIMGDSAKWKEPDAAPFFFTILVVLAMVAGIYVLPLICKTKEIRIETFYLLKFEDKDYGTVLDPLVHCYVYILPLLFAAFARWAYAGNKFSVTLFFCIIVLAPLAIHSIGLSNCLNVIPHIVTVVLPVTWGVFLMHKAKD